MKYLFFYYLIITIFTFLLYAIDKRKAIKNKYRISEKMLLGFCFFGGALGGLLAMYTCHHKTKHFKFILLVPLFLCMHIGIIYLLLK